jgi:hypothetical protein
MAVVHGPSITCARRRACSASTARSVHTERRDRTTDRHALEPIRIGIDVANDLRVTTASS